MVVKAELEKLHLRYLVVKIGEVVLFEDISSEKLKLFDTAIRKSGLELMDNRKKILVEKIKSLIIELVHYTEEQIKVNLSVFLSEKLNHDYTYLANLFSEVKGITIEKFYLAHKIEKVKELIVYDELNLTEIAYKTAKKLPIFVYERMEHIGSNMIYHIGRSFFHTCFG